MKKRSGFVSNSSTSSFICEICGFEAAGHSVGADELGFKVCWNEHVFCEKHLDLPKPIEYFKFLQKNQDEIAERLEELRESSQKEHHSPWKERTEKRFKEFQEMFEVLQEVKGLNESELKEYLKNLDSDINSRIQSVIDSEYMDSYESYHPYFCPICSFKLLSLTDLKFYIISEYKIQELDIFAEIKKQNPRRKKLHTSEFIELALKKIGKEKSELEMEIQNRFQNLETLEKWFYK